jgi:hypothetical protein
LFGCNLPGEEDHSQTQTEDGTGSTQYSYDYAGRVTGEARTVMGMTLNTAYAYYPDGAVHTMTYPSGRTASFTRSVTGAITGATATWSGKTDTLISAATPFPFGGYRSLTCGNGVVNNLGYDLDGRLASLTAGNFLSYAYSRLPGGDITGINDLLHPSWSSDFSYDPVGRLLSGLGSWGLEGYTCDFAGNRMSKVVDGLSTTYNYLTGSNRLASASGAESGVFSHDGMGNMTQGGEYSFDYDASGRMKKAYHLGSLAGEYRYNASGQRVSKNGQRLYAYGLSGELVGEYQSDGTPVSEVVYADGMRVAEYRDIKTPPPPLPRGPQGYNLSRDAGYAGEDRTFIKATDTLYCRVWAEAVDPAQERI